MQQQYEYGCFKMPLAIYNTIPLCEVVFLKKLGTLQIDYVYIKRLHEEHSVLDNGP